MDEQTQTIAKWLGTGSINLFGRPFAGKDTQGRILADMFNGELVAGGDILRSHHDQEEIARIMSTGDLIPTDFYLSILLPFLSQPDFAQKPLILSAVGRLQGEESIIIEATTSSNHPIKAVVLLELSEEEVWRRYDASKLQHDRGDRADDQRTVLENRLRKFREKTMPVIEYYRNNGLLIEIDGTLSREQVTDKILTSLVNRSAL